MTKPADFPRTWFSALVLRSIRWDNCEGGVATVAEPGQVIAVTYHGMRNGAPSYSAHFDYGDHTISDYIGVSENIQVVSHAEGRRLQAEYRRAQIERVERRRLELMEPGDDFNDLVEEFGENEEVD